MKERIFYLLFFKLLEGLSVSGQRRIGSRIVLPGRPTSETRSRSGFQFFCMFLHRPNSSLSIRVWFESCNVFGQSGQEPLGFNLVDSRGLIGAVKKQLRICPIVKCILLRDQAGKLQELLVGVLDLSCPGQTTIS